MYFRIKKIGWRKHNTVFSYATELLCLLHSVYSAQQFNARNRRFIKHLSISLYPHPPLSPFMIFPTTYGRISGSGSSNLLLHACYAGFHSNYILDGRPIQHRLSIGKMWSIFTTRARSHELLYSFIIRNCMMILQLFLYSLVCLFNPLTHWIPSIRDVQIADSAYWSINSGYIFNWISRFAECYHPKVFVLFISHHVKMDKATFFVSAASTLMLKEPELQWYWITHLL